MSPWGSCFSEGVPIEAGEFCGTPRHKDSRRRHNASHEKPGGSGPPGSTHAGTAFGHPREKVQTVHVDAHRLPSVVVAAFWRRVRCVGRSGDRKGPSHCKRLLLGGSPGACLSRYCGVRSVPPAHAEAVADRPALSVTWPRTGCTCPVPRGGFHEKKST